jgi:hypothetical protein
MVEARRASEGFRPSLAPGFDDPLVTAHSSGTGRAFQIRSA